MKKIYVLFLFLLPLLAACAEKKVYIVYFGEHKGDKALHEIEETHHSYLYGVKETSEEEARACLLYSYKHSINGFAALLTPQEASKLSELEEVVSVFESHPKKYSLHTTRSWQFVGMKEAYGDNFYHHHDYLTHEFHQGRSDFLNKAEFGKNIIVGLLDSGVWPESQSFSDEGMGPIPKQWKGICQSGLGFNTSHCNKKIIGARYYSKGFKNRYKISKLNTTEDYESPRDLDGHGTHTSSTVAGARVPNAAALGGFARGTASGGAPLAHLAMYKVCWAIPNEEKAAGNVCMEEDMLAAIDDAIGDGVDVLSISIGTSEPVNYTDDGISIGALHAIKNNIVVACSAGNNGPTQSSLANPAPWIITVGASTLDRAFLASILMGNGKKISGQSAAPYELDGVHPLVYAEDAVLPHVPKNESSQCLPNSLSPEKVKGKIVFCLRGLGMRVGKGLEVKRAGGAGYILGNSPANGNELIADAHVLPAVSVGVTDGVEIVNYIKSTKNPVATLFKGRTVTHITPAPSMTGFTSRGPNVIDPSILKPDITAPGQNILAAWTGGDSPTKLSVDHRVVKYNLLSGTSMSCPHVAAAAALLKAIHPTWSSAAIRSALMTTTGIRNNLGGLLTDSTGQLADPLQYGAGHFRPTKAADPGLVYDASYNDYLVYLCSYGLKNIDPDFKCPEVTPPTIDLNYPSIQIPKLNGSVTIKRTVTNVGDAKSVYFFRSKPPVGFSVKASPSILEFNHVGEKKSFNITVKARKEATSYFKEDKCAFGWFSWSDYSHHLVRSPLVILSLAE